MGLAFFRFDDAMGNPYQSLKDMSALRGDISFGGEKAGVDVGVTVLNMKIKDLYGGSVSKNELGVTLLADYIDKRELSKGEAGDLLVNFGATLEGALLVPLGSTEKPKGSYLEGSIEGSAGGRLIYLNPQDTGKFYIDASVEHRAQIDNFQDQEFTIKKVADNIALGGEVKVYEGNIVKIEGGVSDTDWGKSYSIKGGAEGEKISGNVSYEKRTSDYERFVPSSEKIEFGVTYKGGPKWEVDVIGAKTTEKYKGAQSNDIYKAEVKLKMFLW